MGNKLTNEDRHWGIAQFDTLIQFIEDGKWDYSPSKLKSELQSFKTFTWTEVHPIATLILFIFFVPLGFAPAILYAIVLSLAKPRREQYEVHLAKLRNGTLASKSIATSHKIEGVAVSVSDEIVKLKGLMDTGVLTQREFESAKAKVIGKAA